MKGTLVCTQPENCPCKGTLEPCRIDDCDGTNAAKIAEQEWLQMKHDKEVEKLSELAKMLDGIDYLEIDGSEKMTEAVKFAKENNLLVIFGYSDDLLEMCGVFREEFGAWNGCIVTGGECKIDVRWCDDEESAWSYHLTNCGEHEKFCIMEDGELYSYGIVILDPGVEWKGEDEDD